MSENDKKNLEEIIKEIVMEKLSLSEKSECYSGNWLSLKWDDEEFGESVCLETYPDD